MTNREERPDFYGGNRPSEEYEYETAVPLHNHGYLAPALLDMLGPAHDRRLLDLGCGNGALTKAMADAGFRTVGMESSQSGLEIARHTYPELDWVSQDIDTPIVPGLNGQFDVVVAAEVIEHLFLPRNLFDRAAEALRADGELVITTPFHGYWKNVALAITNKFDQHWRPGWDYGHIKFFSRATLSEMAVEKAFMPRRWKMVGRVPPLAKSMIMVAARA